MVFVFVLFQLTPLSFINAFAFTIFGSNKNLFKYEIKIQCKHQQTLWHIRVCSFTHILERKGKHTLMADYYFEIFCS